MKTSIKTVVLLLALAQDAARSAEYDPLVIPDGAAEQKDSIVNDEQRSREIPIRVFLPQDTDPAAVVLFSHGLGGTRAGCAYLGKHWASRGYVVVFLQHPGSDDSVWKGQSRLQRTAAMRRAASADNFLLRVQDVSAVLEQLEQWNTSQSHFLADRVDITRVGMSGHSFGAVTTQAVSGQKMPIGSGFTDPRIKAAALMSPSGPRRGGDPKQAFGEVKIPWLLLTGSDDDSPIGATDAGSRRVVFPALPPGEKYELVLDGAEHSAFTDRPLPGDREERNPNHHQSILAITTAFWDAYLNDDVTAKQWLDGELVRGVLDRADRWQKK